MLSGDVGARFLARIIGHYSSRPGSGKVKVLVATSGDSGGAVAAGFKDVPGVEVYILYPSGRLSRMQREQLDVAAGAVHPIEVLGTFDDCQRLVKEAFGDGELRRSLSSRRPTPSTSAACCPRCFTSFTLMECLPGVRRATCTGVW